MSYSGRVPKAGVRTTIHASDLHPDPDDLGEEYRQAFGDDQSQEAVLEEAWFVALRRARKQFVQEFRRYPEALVFTASEAERVAALPQMREHVVIWRKYVGAHAILPCGLPDMLRGMKVEIRG